MNLPPLPTDFYLREDVVQVSKDLLGKILCTRFDGKLTTGKIVETEAYAGKIDRASHAWNGRLTNRTRIMYAEGGVAYVYLCYGIHHLFNIVTNREGVPHAVLVRAVDPLAGISVMLQRRSKEKLETTLTSGPGALSQALGINRSHTGISLRSSELWIAEGETIIENQIISSARVGVAYAAEHASWPWRFRIKDCKWTSPAR
ncbi:MAG: DNA-3-methyladenine glycosylase [Bacteroidia bacterium]